MPNFSKQYKIQGLLALICFFVCILVAVPTLAQTRVIASESTPQIDVRPESWGPVLDNASKAVQRRGITENELDQIISDTADIRNQATIQVERLQPKLDELTQQITELGPTPADGEPEESKEAKDQRTALNSQFSKIDTDVKAARLAILRTQQIQRSVVQARQEKFFRLIFVRSDNFFTTEFWQNFSSGINGYFRSLRVMFNDQLVFIRKEFFENNWRIAFVVISFVATILLTIHARRFLTQLVSVDRSDDPTRIYQSRFVEFCRDGIVLALLIFLVHQILIFGHLLTARLNELISSVAIITGLYILSVALIRIILLPRVGRSRMLMINDKPANRIARLLTIGLAFAAFIAALNAIAVVNVSDLAITVVLSAMFAISVAILLLWTMWILRRDRNKAADLTAVVQTSRMMRIMKLLVQLAAVSIVFAALSGYIAFSEFLAQQLIFGLVVIGTVWLLLRFVQNLAAPAIEQASRQAGFVGLNKEADDSSFGQFTILATGVVTLVLYLAAAILLLIPWGYRTSDFYQVVEHVFFGFEIGGLRVSISTVLIVIGLFFLGYLVTVSLRSWLKNKLLPTTHLDVGISNSISTVFGYVGFVLAAIMAVTVAGFNLSNLAIVAGALSVGVGFGLQSIVNNFVSGLILLAERPIKAGDWIVTSGGEGTVTKISVRSTEIQTFDRATVIIPNSTLITDNVTNWTHENKTGRLIIRIGVAYDSDVEEVKEILLNCAKEHRLVLGRPAPAVFFMDFGASSLDFELRCFLADVTDSLTVKSELRFAILSAFRKANIEIPFPQRDLNVRGLDLSNAAADSNP